MSKILELFPTPVYCSKSEKNITKKELNFVYKAEKTKILHSKYTKNGRSKNTHVLENSIFKDREKEILKHVMNYFKQVLDVKNLKPKITQSWFTYINTHDHFPPHLHANSFLSGVFYIKSNNETDSISFYKNPNSGITPNYNNWNIYNSSSWHLPVNALDIVIFPSYLQHGINTKVDNNKRISLAFNVFVEGELGNEYTLDFLKI